ncbi:hypothetical protein RQP46_005523 [Phenoliferia psychrophenolica]
MAPAPPLRQQTAYTLTQPFDLVPEDPTLVERVVQQGGEPAAPLGPRSLARRNVQEGLASRAIAERSIARRSLSPNSTQQVTIGVIAVYAVVIGILWHVPILSKVLWPFKMLTIAFHEFGHAATGCCTGASIKSISLDPREGGVTQMAGGINWITLPSGYLGSSIIGALLIFCGFDTTASKVASFVLALCFLLTAFIAHAEALRFYVLFLGTMSNLYSVWDIVDDLILRKDGGSSACWGVVWAIISLCFMACAIVGGIAAFPETFAQQNADSKNFIPTMRF